MIFHNKFNEIFVKVIVVNLFICFLTLLETVPFVFDHLWTQDIPIFPLVFGGKTGPYINRGGSKLKVRHFKHLQQFNEY